jgi:hypothetical protein
MGRCQQKNVWLFVHAMSVLAHLASVKHYFSHTEQYLNERNVENFDTATIVRFLIPFIFIPCF